MLNDGKSVAFSSDLCDLNHGQPAISGAVVLESGCRLRQHIRCVKNSDRLTDHLCHRFADVCAAVRKNPVDPACNTFGRCV